jgi:two-component system, NarL family, nitrate/nitrite response regulator NarL
MSIRPSTEAERSLIDSQHWLVDQAEHRPSVIDRPAGETVSDTPPQRLHRSASRRVAIPTIVLDRNLLFRLGLIHLLAKTRFRVVADGASLRELPSRIANARHGLVLLGIDGETAEILAELAPLRRAGFRVVMLGNRLDAQTLSVLLGAGGQGYLLKDEISSEMLLKSLELVLLGAVIVPRELVRGLAIGAPGRVELLPQPIAAQEAVLELPPPSAPSQLVPPSTEPSPTVGLSAREHEILVHLMQGASNKHIARDLYIAEATVKVHVKSLLRKIQAKNRTQAAMWGINHQLPTPK